MLVTFRVQPPCGQPMAVCISLVTTRPAALCPPEGEVTRILTRFGERSLEEQILKRQAECIPAGFMNGQSSLRAICKHLYPSSFRQATNRNSSQKPPDPQGGKLVLTSSHSSRLAFFIISNMFSMTPWLSSTFTSITRHHWKMPHVYDSARRCRDSAWRSRPVKAKIRSSFR